MFLASTLLSFVSYFLPADLDVISWGHQSIILTVPICILIAVFYLKLTQLFNRFDLKWFLRVFAKRSHAVFLISIITLAAVNAPFLYYRFSMDSETLSDMYGLFAITTQDDYELMLCKMKQWFWLTLMKLGFSSRQLHTIKSFSLTEEANLVALTRRW